MFRLLTVFAAANGTGLVSALRLHGGNNNRRVHATTTGGTDTMNHCRVFSRTGDSDFFTTTSSSRGNATSRDKNNERKVLTRENDGHNDMLSRTARTTEHSSNATSRHDSNNECKVFSREGAKHNGMLPSTGRITPVPRAPTSRGSSLRGCKVFSRTGQPNGLPTVTERSGASTERGSFRVARVFAREGQRGDARIGMQTTRLPVITDV